MVCFHSQGTDLLGFQSDRRNSRINSRKLIIIAAAGLTPTKHNCSRSRFITDNPYFWVGHGGGDGRDPYAAIVVF